MRFEREETTVIGESRKDLAEKFRSGKKLSEKEMLALLLSYAVKTRDTDVLAQRLLYRFRSLSGVLDAPPALLRTVPGVTLSCAALLKSVPALRRFRTNPVVLLDKNGTESRKGTSSKGKKPVSGPAPASAKAQKDASSRQARHFRTEKGEAAPPSYAETVKRLRGCFAGEKKEAAGVLLFNKDGVPISFCRIGRGENGVLTSDMRTLAKELIRTDAAHALIAHNHPGGLAVCSDSDLLAAEAIGSVLTCFGTEMIGQAVFGKDRSHFIPHDNPERKQQKGKAVSMKNEIRIATFNIQHCRNYLAGKIDYPFFADAVRALGADVIGLNEVRGEGPAEGYDAQAEILAEATGYRYYFAKAIDVGGKNPYGNAILSRLPILSAKTVPIPDPPTRTAAGHYETRCVLAAEIEPAPGEEPLTVLISHFGLNPDERESAVKTVLSLLPERRALLMGDFNATPDDITIAPLFEKLVPVCRDFLTFPSDKPDRKIDHIFLTADLSASEEDCPTDIVSDHLPLTVKVGL